MHARFENFRSTFEIPLMKKHPILREKNHILYTIWNIKKYSDKKGIFWIFNSTLRDTCSTARLQPRPAYLAVWPIKGWKTLIQWPHSTRLVLEVMTHIVCFFAGQETHPSWLLSCSRAKHTGRMARNRSIRTLESGDPGGSGCHLLKRPGEWMYVAQRLKILQHWYVQSYDSRQSYVVFSDVYSGSFSSTFKTALLKQMEEIGN